MVTKEFVTWGVPPGVYFFCKTAVLQELGVPVALSNKALYAHWHFYTVLANVMFYLWVCSKSKVIISNFSGL